MSENIFDANTSVIGLIDDDTDMLHKLEKDLLADGSRQAFIAPKPDIAFSWVMSNEVDLLACDLNLGVEKNGFEVLKECQKIDEDLPLILFTRGVISKEMISECEELNISFLDKANGRDFVISSIINKLNNRPHTRIEKLTKLKNELDSCKNYSKNSKNEFETIIASQLINELEEHKKTGRITTISTLGGSNKSIDDLINDVKSKNKAGQNLIKIYFDLNLTKTKIKNKRKKGWFRF